MSNHDHHDGNHGSSHGYYTYRGHRYYGYYYPQPTTQTTITVVQPQVISPDVGTILGVGGILALAAVLIYVGTRK